MALHRDKGNWRPEPAECRKWLQRAENDICARTGRPQQVRDQDELRRAMLGSLCGVHGETVKTEEWSSGAFIGKRMRIDHVTFPRVWDRDRLGPMPTEPGCRLGAATQRDCWRRYFTLAFDPTHYELEIVAHIDGYRRDEPMGREVCLLAATRRLEALGIAVAPPACPILHGVMVEMHVPMAPDDLARIEHQERQLLEIADERASIEAEERELLAMRRSDKYNFDVIDAKIYPGDSPQPGPYDRGREAQTGRRGAAAATARRAARNLRRANPGRTCAAALPGADHHHPVGAQRPLPGTTTMSEIGTEAVIAHATSVVGIGS